MGGVPASCCTSAVPTSVGTAQNFEGQRRNSVKIAQNAWCGYDFRFTGNFCNEEEEEVAALAGGREDCEFIPLKDSCTLSDTLQPRRAWKTGATTLWGRGAGQVQRRKGVNNCRNGGGTAVEEQR